MLPAECHGGPLDAGIGLLSTATQELGRGPGNQLISWALRNQKIIASTVKEGPSARLVHGSSYGGEKLLEKLQPSTLKDTNSLRTEAILNSDIKTYISTPQVKDCGNPPLYAFWPS